MQILFAYVKKKQYFCRRFRRKSTAAMLELVDKKDLKSFAQ